MKKITLMMICLLGLGEVGFGQDVAVDSKGETVFAFYSLPDWRFEFSSKTPLSLGVSGKRFRTTYKTKTKLMLTKDTTVVKESGVYYKLELLNSSKLFTFSTLNQIDAGIKANIGWQMTLGKVKRLIGKGAWVYGANSYLAIDNFNIYNTISKNIEKKKPTSFGIDINISHIFPKSDGKEKFHVLSAIASFSKTWNDDDLLNYREIENVTITQTVIGLDKFSGRFGELNENINKLRVAVSYATVVGIFNPIPYIIFTDNNISAPKYHVGLFLNILSKKLDKADYTIPSSIGLGIDFINAESKWSSANIFLKGSINFGKIN
jgi:hypothetical protein